MKQQFIVIFLVFLFPLFLVAQEIEQINEDSGVVEEEEELTTSSLTEAKKGPVVHRYIMGEGIKFSAPDKSYMMRLRGYTQFSYQTYSHTDAEKINSRWRMRRIRARLYGYAHQNKIRYRFGIDMVRGSEIDVEGDGNDMLMDASITYRPLGNSRLSITFGQRSAQTDNRENIMNTYSLQFSERSRLAAAFGTIREVGVTVRTSHRLGKYGYIRPAFVITDGDGSFTYGKRHGGLKYGMRVNYLPFGLFRVGGEFSLNDMIYEPTHKLSIGATYSYNDGTSDRRGGRDTGKILYQNKNGDITLPDFARMNLDFLYKYRGWNFLGEFTKTWAYVPSDITTRVRRDGSTSQKFLIDGKQNVKDYIRNRMILGSAFNIQGGYTFRNYWTVNARYTQILPDKYSFLNNTLYYSRNNAYEFSVAKYLTKNYAAKIQFSATLLKTNGEVRSNTGTFTGYESSFNILTQISF